MKTKNVQGNRAISYTRNSREFCVVEVEREVLGVGKAGWEQIQGPWIIC